MKQSPPSTQDSTGGASPRRHVFNTYLINIPKILQIVKSRIWINTITRIPLLKGTNLGKVENKPFMHRAHLNFFFLFWDYAWVRVPRGFDSETLYLVRRLHGPFRFRLLLRHHRSEDGVSVEGEYEVYFSFRILYRVDPARNYCPNLENTREGYA